MPRVLKIRRTRDDRPVNTASFVDKKLYVDRLVLEWSGQLLTR